MKVKVSVLIMIILVIISSCAPSPEIIAAQTAAVWTQTPEPTEEVVAEESTIAEEKTIKPTPTPDVSSWIVNVGDMKCSPQPLSEKYPDWYLVDCTEDLWLPISQTTIIEVYIDGESCDLRSMELLEEVAQEYFLDALQLTFVQIEDGQWGCYVPYSNQAGFNVGCGFGCEGEEVGIILNGKTIRNYSGGGGESNSSGGGHTGESNSSGGGQAGEEGPPDHGS